MEVLTKARAIKLRSHHDKYLTVTLKDDQETVKLSRNSSSTKSIWIIEKHDTRQNIIRIKSWQTGNYLTAIDAPFLLGMTGKKVVLTNPDNLSTDWNIQWEPITDGFQLKIKSWCGKFLRGNGGSPPWRNSVTHDEPHTSATKDWVLWDVVNVVELPEGNDAVLDSLSSNVSSVYEEPQSPMSVKSATMFSIFSAKSPRSNSSIQSPPQQQQQQTGMEFFHKAKAVRFRSHHDKYLLAEDDEESVTQDRNGSSKTAKWTVEIVPGSDSIIRLKSCYNKYLTASNQPYLLGMTGRKVTQSLPKRLDSSLEWEPIRDGNQLKLKTRYGNFLRANGGLPPWRNSVTHDVPHRSSTQDWILWDVDVVEIHLNPRTSINTDPPKANHHDHDHDRVVAHQDSLDFEADSPNSAAIRSNNASFLSRQESNDSYVSSPPKSEGRMIYYHIADDQSGDMDDESLEAYSFHFKGNGVDELTRKLREDSGYEDIIVCSRSPLNRKLYPLRLQLPPNNADMHVVVVPASSKCERFS
ncbi:hypothetical protein ACFE04_022922 [Oxalis oulophora]